MTGSLYYYFFANGIMHDVISQRILHPSLVWWCDVFGRLSGSSMLGVYLVFLCSWSHPYYINTCDLSQRKNNSCRNVNSSQWYSYSYKFVLRIIDYICVHFPRHYMASLYFICSIFLCLLLFLFQCIYAFYLQLVLLTVWSLYILTKLSWYWFSTSD